MSVKTIEWRERQLVLLDQRVLPNTIHYITCTNSKEVAEAISNMVVRGAPAIGIAAAYGMAMAVRNNEDLQLASQQLAQSRPTAVNLFWALERVQDYIQADEGNLIEALEQLAIEIHQEDAMLCDAIAKHGADAIMAEPSNQSVTIYTHCNTGALATGGVGTALGVIHELYNRQSIKQVFAGETRPWLQGARLTAFELNQHNIPFQLVCDSAAAHTMKTKSIDWLIVGADRIAANGDTANKIGTFQLALIAKQLGVKVMVAAPTTTIDFSIKTGAAIEIEQRSAKEVSQLNGQSISIDDCPAFNPAFDITPQDLIDVIVTEKGVFKPADLLQSY